MGSAKPNSRNCPKKFSLSLHSICSTTAFSLVGIRPWVLLVDCSHDCVAEKSPLNRGKILLSSNLLDFCIPFSVHLRNKSRGFRKKKKVSTTYSYQSLLFLGFWFLRCLHPRVFLWRNRKERTKFQFPFHVPIWTDALIFLPQTFIPSPVYLLSALSPICPVSLQASVQSQPCGPCLPQNFCLLKNLQCHLRLPKLFIQSVSLSANFASTSVDEICRDFHFVWPKIASSSGFFKHAAWIYQSLTNWFISVLLKSTNLQFSCSQGLWFVGAKCQMDSQKKSLIALIVACSSLGASVLFSVCWWSFRSKRKRRAQRDGTQSSGIHFLLVSSFRHFRILIVFGRKKMLVVCLNIFKLLAWLWTRALRVAYFGLLYIGGG